MGGDALLAAFAIILKDESPLHLPDREAVLLKRARDMGMIDGISGYVEATADGLGLAVHRSMMQLLATLAQAVIRGT